MTRCLERLYELASAQDSNDPLGDRKNAFELPAEVIYLDGNSLGPLTKLAKQRVNQVVSKEWGEDLITSWNVNGWIDLPRDTGEKIALLLGADKDQVVCCDSISVNLFKVLCAALRLNSSRKKVVTTIDNFPTDGYMVQGLNDLLGDGRCELVSVNENDILDALTEDISVLLLTQINFRTGNKLDIEMITQRAHDAGILVIWDLAHSAGVMPLSLDKWNVDFAVGCGYKFLNGGPGAPAFVYVSKALQSHYKQPLQGWMGHAQPFVFSSDYQGAEGIRQNLVGTPSVVSMSLLDASLEVFDGLEMNEVFDKSQQLIDWFVEVAEHLSLLKYFDIATPLDRSQRGAHLALQHEHAYAICQALINEHVIADFRSPNILRLGFSPLFLSFTDILKAGVCLSSIMTSQRYLETRFNVKHKVT